MVRNGVGICITLTSCSPDDVIWHRGNWGHTYVEPIALLGNTKEVGTEGVKWDLNCINLNSLRY